MATTRLDKDYWESRWANNATGWRDKERAVLPFAKNALAAITTVMDLCDDEDVSEWLASLRPESDAPDPAVSVLRRAMANATVFIPLCGDTLALSFFSDAVGCDVVGVDIAEASIQRALTEQFATRNASWDEVSIDNGASLKRVVLTGEGCGRVTLYVGDAFGLMADRKLVAGHVDFIYDRGSLMAIEPTIRSVYTQAMCNVMLTPGTSTTKMCLSAETGSARVRCVTFLVVADRPEGPTQLTDGPPFHITAADLYQAYGGKLGGLIIPLIQPEQANAESAAPFVETNYAIVTLIRGQAP